MVLPEATRSEKKGMAHFLRTTTTQNDVIDVTGSSELNQPQLLRKVVNRVDSLRLSTSTGMLFMGLQ